MPRLDPIEVLIRGEKWLAARKAIRTALPVRADGHWLLTRLALTYYETRDYAGALRYSERAVESAPRCPLVLWDYAGALQMLGRHEEAMQVYSRLIRKGPKRIAKGPCGEGLARARGLVADCHYRIAKSLGLLGRRKESLREFEAHLDMRGPGCQSIYPIEKVSLSGRAPTNRRRTA